MSSHSPTVIQAGAMAHGLADLSAVFGRSILDGEVPYPEAMAGLPTSTPNPSALKKKARRSWFETTPSKLEIAVKQPAPTRKPLIGEVEVLTLTHFTAAPRLDFGTMKPGQVKVCTLLLRNPHECEQTVKVEKVPEKKHFTVASKTLTVGPGESYPLEVTWSPPEPGNFREMILMQVDKSYRLQAYVFGTVVAPPQKKKRRVGLLASKVNKPFSVIQTASLSTINHQYSPDKNRRSGEAKRRSARLSGQGLKGKPEKKENVNPRKESDVRSRNVNKKSLEGKDNVKTKEVETKVRNTKRSSADSKENVLQAKNVNVNATTNVKKKSIEQIDVNRINVKNEENIPDRVPRKKLRRSNTYSNVSNQGLLIPVIHGDTVQGQMDTSLLDIVDKCNVSGIQALEQSFNSLNDNKNAVKVSNKIDCKQTYVEKSNFLEASMDHKSPDLDKIESQIIPYGHQQFDEPSFLQPNVNSAIKDHASAGRVRNVKLETLKNNDTFHDSLENGLAAGEVSKYQEQPSFLSPEDRESVPMSHSLRRSARKSVGKVDSEEGGVPTEVKLLKSLKRRSGRRSITKERRRSSLNKSGSKSIIEQLKNLRTFIKEKSFEIESGDEPSFLKPAQEEHLDKKQKTGTEVNVSHSVIPTTQDAGNNLVEIRRDTFLADSSKLKLLESQKPSEASPRRTTFTVLRKNPPVKSPARSKSEGNRPQNNLAALDEVLDETEDGGNTKESFMFVEVPVKNECVAVMNDAPKGLKRKSESPTKRHFSADSLENDSFEPVFTSPKPLRQENPETFERRATLTVTKSRPSDALMHQLEKQTANLFQTVDASFEVTNEEALCSQQADVEKNDTINNVRKVQDGTFEKSEIKGHSSHNNSEVSFSSTPNHLPSSPNPNMSRRSTHIVKQPKVIDFEKVEQRELFPGNTDSGETENLPDSLANSTRRRRSVRRSIASDGLTAAQSSNKVQERFDMDAVETVNDSPAANTRRRSLRHEVPIKKESNNVQPHRNGSDTEEAHDTVEDNESTNKIVKNSREKAHDIVSNDEKVQHQVDEKPESGGLIFIPIDDKENNKGTAKGPARPKTVVDPKQFLRKRGNPVPVAITMDRPKRVRKETVDLPKKTVPSTDKKAAQAIKPAVKDTRVNTRTKTTIKEKTNLVKGLAQSKLILLKKSKTALPKHPLPFAAKNMYYDERWMEKQERGFVNWLNFILTPAEEYQGNDVKVKVDAGKLTVDVAKGSVKLAPTNEVLSFRAYSAHRKLNRLRKSACRLFQSDSVIRVIQKLEGEVESCRLAVRKDKMIHADIGLKQKLLDMLLCYNPLWLRVGMETIYGEVVPLQSNSDVVGLSRFILTRLLTSPDISQEFAHPTVPHLYRDGYAEATAAHSLKKFLMLVYFLDRAKQERLIEHNPCLFCKNSDIKANRADPDQTAPVGAGLSGSSLFAYHEMSTKDLLLLLSRDYLSGEGDITRHLGYLGYKVSYTQTALDEFDFAVSKLSTDLRDGLRLTKVLELLCNRPELSRTLRVPAISRLQKVHNVEVVFKALLEQKIATENVVARDIVDGHREKTLKLLWNLILHYQVEILLDEKQLREEVAILEKSLRVKDQLQRLLKYSTNNKSKRESEGPDLHTQNPRLNLLLKWCRAVCAFFNIKVENFTVSFSDGRALCHIVHYYHPGLLPLDHIRNETSMTHLEKMEKNTNRDMNASFNDSFNSSGAAFGDTEDPEVYDGLLKNERENFKLLFEKVKELGGIPLMLKWSDMSNTIPDEKVVVTYLLYLCARLLDIRHESRAARVIQLAWRKYRLKAVEAELEVKNRAASKIQRCVKDFLVRRKREREEAQKHAVVLLQRAILSYLHRRRYLQMKAAFIKFQACCRGFLLRKKRNDAAMIIQSALRCYLAKKRTDKMRDSVVKVQSCVRGYLARKHAKKCKNATVSIQRRFRDYCAMKKDRQNYSDMKGSCILIQKCWRKYRLRQKEKVIKAAVKIQAAFRGLIERRKYLRVRDSAIILQGVIRCYKQRKLYLRQKEATVTIQKHFRSYKVTKEMRSEFKRLRQAVVFMQSQRRMIMERKRYEISVKSLITVQSFVRMFLARRSFLKFREATCVIQKLCRAFACRKKYLISLGAAITLQAGIRGYLVRKEVKKQHAAATVIQASVRKVVQIRKYLALKAAVILCQSRVRANIVGRQQSKEYAVLKQAVLTTQNMFRGKQYRLQYMKCRNSIVKAQATARMVIMRRYYMKLKTTTLLVQRLYRAKRLGEKCRNELQVATRATVTIQSAYRGYCARKEIRRQHDAATVIQSHVRCMNQRRRYHKQTEAVVLCQHRVRAKLAGRRQMECYQNMRRAAVVIQSFIRGHKCRQVYQASYRHIVKVQSVCRMFIERRRFMRKKRAALVVQRRFWALKAGYVCKLNYHITREATITLQAGFRGLRVRRGLKKQQTAAVCIQKHVKGFIQRRLFTRLKHAVVTMQGMYRAKREGDTCRKQLREKKSAAVVIQSSYRGYQVRKEIRQKNLSATTIQTAYRSFVQKKRFATLKHAVITMQRLYRAKMEGVKCRTEYLEKKSAAVIVQKYYQGYLVRKDIKQKNLSATTIQTAYRSFIQKKRFDTLKHAVITMQRLYRAKMEGVKCRTEYLEKKSAAVVVQKYYQGYLVRKDIKQKNLSATTIQTAYRSFIQKKRFDTLKHAVVAMQRLYRAKMEGAKCRTEYLEKKSAAVTIQKYYQGYLVRKEIKQQNLSATTIQTAYRSFIQKKRFITLKNAVVTMQRLHRAKTEGVKCKKQYLETKSAAITIQKYYHGYLVRKDIKQKNLSATKIQTAYKRFVQKKIFTTWKSAVIATQRLYRAKIEGVKCRNQYLEKKSAAVIVQKYYQGYLVRKDIKQKNLSATTIQTAYRSFIEKKRFITLKNAVVTMQRLYRAKMEGIKCRNQYLDTKSATITVQKYYRGYKVRKEMKSANISATVVQSSYRGYIQRKWFNRLKNSVVAMQRVYHAKTEGVKVRQQYLEKKSAAVTLQSHYRGYIVRKEMKHKNLSATTIQTAFRRYQQQTRYVNLRRAVSICQKHYRAKLTGRKIQGDYLTVKTGITKLQALVRGRLGRRRYVQMCSARRIQSVYRMYRCRKDYQTTRCHIVRLQAAVRGFLARNTYNHAKRRVEAASVLQRRWRARVQGQSDRNVFLRLQRSVMVIQRYVRARIAGQKVRQEFCVKKQSAILIQASVRGMLQRKRYLQQRKAAVKLQAAFRGYHFRMTYSKLRNATVTCQRVYRANVTARLQQEKYQAIRKNITVLQSVYRGFICRKSYKAVRQAAIQIQSLYRGYRARQACRAYLKAVIIIQTRWRAKLLRRKSVSEYQKLRNAAVVVQKNYHAKCQRQLYLEMKEAALTFNSNMSLWEARKLIQEQKRQREARLQKLVRVTKAHLAAVQIQRCCRAHLVKREAKKRLQSATLIQSVWKGYLVRRRSTSKKVAAVRKRVMEANASATEEKKLYNRTTSALDFLLKYKQMSYVLDALRHLEVVTRLSWSCCERMVEANAVTVLYQLIRACNRSLPHMEIIKITVQIMFNLAKYDKTRASLYEEADSTSTLLELMQIYREKGPIFIKTCTLLGIMALDTDCKMAIMNDKKLTEKLKSIHVLTSRKHKLEENQRVTRAKMNATFNTTFTVRSPVKKHKIKPDWALNSKNKIKEIENPLKAINFVLTNLGLNVK